MIGWRTKEIILSIISLIIVPWIIAKIALYGEGIDVVKDNTIFFIQLWWIMIMIIWYPYVRPYIIPRLKSGKEKNE